MKNEPKTEIEAIMRLEEIAKNYPQNKGSKEVITIMRQTETELLNYLSRTKETKVYDYYKNKYEANAVYVK